MVQKRPFTGEPNETSLKHPRQFEHDEQLVSFLEFSSKGMSYKPHTSGDGKDGFQRSITEHDKEPESGTIAAIQKEDADYSPPGGNFHFSWASSYAGEVYSGFEAPFQTLVSPKSCDPNWRAKSLVHSEDISHLDDHPRKLVPIGPDFQADVPEWCPYVTQKASVYSDSAVMSTQYCKAIDYLNIVSKFSGTCVIPMPKDDPQACNDIRMGNYRTFCICEYPGSLECVDLHIVEARENLKRAIGWERFVELGFCDMGEIVSEKWSDDDQQLFQEVVFSNPSSAGKNFWNHLSAVFPSRTKKEIVSYYFNVFMLRIRAQQNRCDSMNIDSDDDEWQESDGEIEVSGEDEVSEEDEDSLGKLPICQGVPSWNAIHDGFSHEYARGMTVRAESHDFDSDLIGCSKGILNFSADSMFQSSKQNSLDVVGDHDINDNSCMSTETGSEDSEPQGNQIKTEYSKSSVAPSNGPSAEGGHEFLLDPCDAKVWDDGYWTCPRNEVEFLPTCSMIEEVFGVGAWNY